MMRAGIMIFSLVLTLSPERAEACSPRTDAGMDGGCVEHSWFSLPSHGAEDAPTNTRFTLTRSGGGRWEERTPILRRAADGSEVRLRRESITDLFMADAALEPLTEYVLYDVGDPSSCGVTDRAIEIEVARFTTDTGPDLVPPAPPTVSGVSACSTNRCDSSSCCGPYELTSYRLLFTESPDADVVHYVRTDGLPLSMQFGRWQASIGYPLDVGSAAGPPDLSIRSVDRAGNLSVASPPIDASRCAAGGDPGTAPGTAPSSCDLAVPRSGSAWVAVSALVVLLAVTRRRARR